MVKLKVWRLLSAWMVLVLTVGLGVGLAPATPDKAATNPVDSWTDVSTAAVENPLQFTSGGHVLGFNSDGVIIASADHMLKTEFIGSRAVAPEADAAALAEDNASMASPLSRVTYHDVWDGVTVVYEASPGAIVESTYYVNATEKGLPYDLIRLGYNRTVSLDENGNLVIAFETGTIVESAPVAWQEIDGRRQPVTAAFALYGEYEVGFSLDDYVPGIPVVIDPDLMWNTFLGGSEVDWCYGIAVDGSGNVYVAGYSNATWGSPVRNYTASVCDAFAAKLNSSGNLVWNTFLGDSGIDYGRAIAVDGSGNVYVAGHSTAGWGSPVRPHEPGINYDAFAARLDSSGNLVWNTFLGGSGDDWGSAIALDGSSNVYVAGFSSATWGFPVLPHTFGTYDAFAARLDSSGGLVWNTFLGSSGTEYGHAIAVDGSGNIYVAGYSSATWGSPVQDFAGGLYDAFAARLDSSGGLAWNTFLGGGGDDRGHAIAVDGSGNVYIAGPSGTTWGSPVHAYDSNEDAFAAGLDSSGGLIWNTFLGGGGTDYVFGIAVGGWGNVYVAGYSTATWGSPVRAYTAGASLVDAFAAELDSSGNLVWNTFLGGSGNDDGLGIAADSSGNAYVCGTSTATWGSPVRAYTASVDAFAAKISGPPPEPEEPKPPAPPKPRVSPPPPSPYLPPADVRLNGITVSSSETQPGQPVTVLANLVNNGSSSGSYNVALRINGKVERQKTVEVSPGTAYPVKFTVTKSEPGTYEVAIEGQRASFTVVGEGTSGAPASGGLIALIVMALLILATAVVLMMTLRRPA